jgi:hypothetical protein
MAKGQQRDPRREAFWRGVMRRFGESGLTVRAFCAGERLSEPSFYAWRRVFRRRDAERTAPGALAFVPVVVDVPVAVDDAEPGRLAGAGIEIEVRGDGCGGLGCCILRLPAALPIRQVAELVGAIAAARGAPGNPGSVGSVGSVGAADHHDSIVTRATSGVRA